MAALALLAPAVVSPPAPGSAQAGTPLSGFRESTVISGLTNPMVVRFAPDGRVFVAEKSGLIKVFSSISSTSPTVFADLRTNVYNFWDRGLLGMALDPNFPAQPYVYVLYTYDHELGSTSPPPRWGTPGTTSDPCPTPPGPTTDGCVVSARLSRLQASGNAMTGSEQVLVEDWCQQYPSHSIGQLEFGPDGMLYASAGDGASFTFVDYGQQGSPRNPCGDPPGGVGATLSPPTAEGGSLRSQDLRTSGDPVTLDGSVIRIDPATGAEAPGNPLFSHPDANARRIVAYGLRNPFRFAFRPGTSELWLGDVGWGDWEEINRILSPTDALVENFGWPCYEGQGRQSGYEGANLDICTNLYTTDNAVTPPYYAYNHNGTVVPNESCPTGSSSISGLAFEGAVAGNTYPAAYQGGLYFSDYSRKCIWVMKKGANGLPDAGSIETFVAAAAGPVGLEFGPGGDLFYVDFDGGTIRRISYVGGDSGGSCPTGEFRADYFANLTLGGSPTISRCETSIDNNWGTGGPGGGIPNDNFSVRWTGSFSFPAGSATFTVTADDGIRLWVNGQLLIDKWIDQAPTTYTATRTVTEGVHEVKVEYYEKTGGAVARASWSVTPTQTPPASCSTGEFRADYFANLTLGGSPTISRCETSIDNNWGTGGPGGGIPNDDFSVRWTGSFSFPAGSATFTVTADDGIRLWVDGQLLIDKWIDQAPTTYTATANLTQGVHLIKVEYYEKTGGAVARASWTTGASPNTPPTPIISSPSSSLNWKVGDVISFSGSASDAEDGPLPASALTWTLILQHCPSNCHAHTIQSWTGVTGGSFTAPDHEYPSWLELRLEARDSGGLVGATTLRLDPATVVLNFATSPSGLQLTVNGISSTAPFTRNVIIGSLNSLTAPSPQSLNGSAYDFQSWSNGGGQTQTITAPETVATFTATYVGQATPPTNTAAPSISGHPRVGQQLTASTGSWSGWTPMTFGYQWLRCANNSEITCVAIGGATSSTYRVDLFDIGLRLRVRVTAQNIVGSSTATSSATPPVKSR